MIEKMYKFSEVSELLGVTKNCLHTWELEGKIKVVNIAPEGQKRMLRISESSLKEIVGDFSL